MLYLGMFKREVVSIIPFLSCLVIIYTLVKNVLETLKDFFTPLMDVVINYVKTRPRPKGPLAFLDTIQNGETE